MADTLAQTIQAGTEIVKDIKTIKSGWKTTEFWISIFTSVGAIMAGVSGILPPEYSAIITIVSNTAYSISRGLAKK